MTYQKETLKGRYNIEKPQKYVGDPRNIIFRSSWELKFMKWCDHNTNVIEWGSEELAIPYRSPIDGRIHRYFVDFYIKVRSPDGIKKYLIEIKPEKFTREPKPQQRKTKAFLNEVIQWGTNQAKWNAAKEFCLDRNWEFLILTEKELGISYK